MNKGWMRVAGQVLYRKYRSGNFAEVIGQNHVVQTLTSAIASGRVSHAYLFTGPRGVGKTSVARLLARALNCTGQDKPCNNCENCQAAINSSLDVVEIDAASNRSIDAVRDLREKVGLAPTRGSYKVYIIDEVHMLTTEAFNALLKTLEEPPSHAVFILATTEAHKLPETIVSRTQRFSFRPITTGDITAHLAKIATSEQINIEPGALEIIAGASRGGFRDALSMLDQLASSNESPITTQTVRVLLGHSGPEEIAAISTAIAGNDPKTALQVLTRLEAEGAQPQQVAAQLAEYWRSIMFANTGAIKQAAATDKLANIPAAQTAYIIETLLEVTRSHWPQLALEAAIVKLAAAPEPAAVTQPAPASRRTSSKNTIAQTAPAAPVTSTATQSAAPQPTASPQAGKLESGLWPKVLVLLKSENNSLCALLQMYPVEFSDEEIVVKPRFNFHRDLFLKPANRAIIEAAALKVYGRAVKVTARTDESGGKPGAPARQPSRPDPNAELITSALEILGGEIVE